MNARHDDEQGVVTRHRRVHLGVAVQTDDGLVVAVLRDAHTMGAPELAAELERVAARARRGDATLAELRGSTITVSSLGALGGIASTPIINHPEVAIVGVNKIQVRPTWVDGAVVPREVMHLSSSFDHRVVDGWHAARFVQRIRELLETPVAVHPVLVLKQGAPSLRGTDQVRSRPWPPRPISLRCRRRTRPP